MGKFSKLTAINLIAMVAAYQLIHSACILQARGTDEKVRAPISMAVYKNGHRVTRNITRGNSMLSSTSLSLSTLETWPNEMNGNINDGRSPGHPINVLNQYIEWHSVEALRQSPKNRTFAIAYYSCPFQAGNRLNQFFSSLLWAIVTNRTLLWKYYDRKTCTRNQLSDKRFAAETYSVCNFTQSEKVCAKVLTRASWIPSYDEFKRKLKLGKPKQVHYWAVTPRSRDWDKDLYPWQSGISYKHQGVDNKTNIRFVKFPIQVAQDLSLYQPRIYQELLHTEFGRKTMKLLHSMGTSFLYGMLFRRTFDFAVPRTQLAIAEGTFTVGLHSRHQRPRHMGIGVKYEQECLNRVLKKRAVHQACAVLIMSDRNATLFILSEWLAEHHNCTTHVAKHESHDSFSIEHGPFSGAGFFQDMELVVRARDAFIGSLKSSSAMVLSLMEYDLVMEAWQEGRKWKTLEVCRNFPAHIY